ncbi:uncharacterized protein LOC120016347 isoform X1 [Tripterygium wilfordii]|uniref:uncharacterized protein LOC120016347 isoform X1 n=1 Tax=Tripterygium wilfordii TaxID=458696 RepID=UPI0018F80687|nr:uncharacterized protein LOC120016347 isoform X1 [Tripterygium wilfordii]
MINIANFTIVATANMFTIEIKNKQLFVGGLVVPEKKVSEVWHLHKKRISPVAHKVLEISHCSDNIKCPFVENVSSWARCNSSQHGWLCKEGTCSCTQKSCKGHDVDIMHFSIGNAVGGRIYGCNPIDNKE